MAINPLLLGLLPPESSLVKLLGQGVGPVAQAARPQIAAGPISRPRVLTGTPPRGAPAPAAQRGAVGMEQPSSFLSGLAAGLERGPGSAYTGPLPAFAAAMRAAMDVTAQNRERKKLEAQAAEQKQKIEDLLNDEGVKLTESERRQIRALPPEEAVRVLGELLKQGETKVVGGNLVDARTGAVVFAEPRNIDPLSEEGIRAKKEIDRYKTELDKELEEFKAQFKNIDPNSAAGIAAAEQIENLRHRNNMALERLRAQLRPPASNTWRVPLGALEAIAQNERTVAALDEAITALQENPKAVGPWHLVPGMSTFLGAVEGEPRVTARGLVQGAGGLVIYERSGKAVNMEELKRMGDIPKIGERTDVVLSKLRKLRSKAANGSQGIRAYYFPEGFNTRSPAGGFQLDDDDLSPEELELLRNFRGSQ